MGVGGQRHAQDALPLAKRTAIRCIGGLMGPRAVLEGCGKSRLHRDSISGPSVCANCVCLWPRRLFIETKNVLFVQVFKRRCTTKRALTFW